MQIALVFQEKILKLFKGGGKPRPYDSPWYVGAGLAPALNILLKKVLNL
jgi:hypothetical protein